jgi:4-methyl-5(b-hydroxyethyl)-thiazole monophosphate biosynthesis
MIALLLAEGFEEVEAVTPADFLRRAGVDVQLVGIGGRTIRGSHEIVFEVDKTIDEVDVGDIDGVILPGGMPGAENIAASGKALALVRKAYEQGKLVAAICAAPAVALQRTGILEGKRVTCYPGYESKLEGCTFVEDRVVVDGNLVTSRGPGTAAEFAEKLIEILVGEESARDVHVKTLQK